MRDTLPPGAYFLPRDESTCAQPLRKVSDMTTSSTEMESGGLLLFLPDFDALTDEAKRGAG